MYQRLQRTLDLFALEIIKISILIRAAASTESSKILWLKAATSLITMAQAVFQFTELNFQMRTSPSSTTSEDY